MNSCWVFIIPRDISSPARRVAREARRFPSASDCRGPACHSVRVDGVALNMAHPMNLEIFEMSVVGVAVPGLATVGSGLLAQIASNSAHTWVHNATSPPITVTCKPVHGFP